MTQPSPNDGTRAFHDRIALVFDFDLTLGPGSFDGLLDRLGLTYAEWEAETLKPMIADGWDEIQAKGASLRQLSRAKGVPITRDLLREVGAEAAAYEKCRDTLDRLAALGHDRSGGAAVEMTILTSGFVDIIQHAPIAQRFDRVWGSSFSFGDDGHLDGVKRAVISVEKARYITALGKGLDIQGANEPTGVAQDIAPGDWHVPLDQMLYIGDGASDVPAFDQVQRAGGLAIGIVHKQDHWETARHIHRQAKVENIAPPDYTDGEPLAEMLEAAVDTLAQRIRLRRLGG